MSNDLRVQKGRTLALTVGLTDDSGNDYTLKSDEKMIFGVKLNTESTEYVLKKELMVADKVDGGYLLSLTAEEMNLTAMHYSYDIALKTADGLYSVVDCSKFIVCESVVNGDE